MKLSTKIGKLNQMKRALRTMQVQLAELKCALPETPQRRMAIENAKLFKKEQLSNRSERAKSIQLKIANQKRAIKAFTIRHKLPVEMASSAFDSLEKQDFINRYKRKMGGG